MGLAVRFRLVLSAVTIFAVSASGCGRSDGQPITPASPSSVAGPGQTFGYRQFRISASLNSSSWVTVELHPTAAPIQLAIQPDRVAEVCPATLAGQISSDSSWPTRFHFPSCIPLDPTGHVSLPGTDGQTHVAFALRTTTLQKDSIDLEISYTAADSFMGVIPPGGNEPVTISYLPHSATTGVQVEPGTGTSSPSGDKVTIVQSGQSIAKSDACDFPSELDCIGPVTPNKLISVTLTPGVSPVLLLLTWD